MFENIDEELVRCRPCGYVMKKSELDKVGVCPACGLPHTVFEPYREKVSPKRLFLLGLDIHPIAIHLSQTFVAMIPFLMLFNAIFPNSQGEIITSVIKFSVFVFPLTLILSFVSGIVDGLTRFKTLETPLLRKKIYYGIAILLISIILFVSHLIFPQKYPILDILLGFAALYCAVRLGMMGKKLIDVILPGVYQRRKKKIIPKKDATSVVKKTVTKIDETKINKVDDI